MSRRRPPAATAGLLMLTGCRGVQSPLNPAGDQADRLFSLLQLLLWVCGLAYLFVLVFLVWAIWRTGGRYGEAETPEAHSDDPGLGRALAVWIGAIFVGLSVLAVGSFLADRALAAARAREALQVKVTGHAWWWRIQYRDPKTGAWVETANELHLPVGRTARVELGSADVIHSFWVPNVAGKMDVIPGHPNVIDLTPRRLGWFRGQCAEFCGVQHAHMAFDVKVEPPAAFDAWLQAQAKPAPAPSDPKFAHGEEVVTGGACAMCHAIRGTAAAGRPGPDLTHVASRRSLAAGTLPMSRAALQGWIAEPQALKPGTNMPAVPLSPTDAEAAARYLESLK
jgi:cytochrome c oxidase subunit 2